MPIRIFFALLTLVILGLAIASSIYIIEKIEKPKALAEQALKESNPAPIDPGIGEFERAITEIRNRQFPAALKRLRYIIKFFPKSTRYEDARALCSQVNLDLLLSPNYRGDKVGYEVQKGDAVTKIAKTHKTTLEYVKRVNQFTEFNLRPGDQVIVRPMEFGIQISMSGQKLVLTEAGAFFAEYPIEKIIFPAGVAVPFSSTVRNRLAWLDDKNLANTAKGYDQADKEIRLNRPGVTIRRTLNDEKEDDGGKKSRETGVFMAAADVDELCVLLRIGSKIDFAL